MAAWRIAASSSSAVASGMGVCTAQIKRRHAVTFNWVVHRMLEGSRTCQPVSRSSRRSSFVAWPSAMARRRRCATCRSRLPGASSSPCSGRRAAARPRRCGCSQASRTPDAGEIRLFGEAVNRRRPYERDLAMVFQSYALFPHLSVERNVAFGLEQRKRPAREIRDRVRAALELVRLDPGTFADSAAFRALGRPAAARCARTGAGARARASCCSTSRSARSTSSSGRKCRSSSRH